jgi:putative transposase
MRLAETDIQPRWVDWLNHHHRYQHCGDIPPVEMETA